MRSRSRLFVMFGAAIIAGACAVGAPTSVAWAQQPDAKTQEEAGKAYGEANELFKKDQFAAALPGFQKADALVPGSMPKYKIAVCLDKLNRKQEAVAAYQAFLTSKPPAKMADKVKEAEGRIKALNKEIASQATVSLQLTPPNPPGLTIMVDGAAVTGTDLTLTPGDHTVSITATGFEPRAEKVTVKAGEKRPLAVTLTALPVAPTPVPTPVPTLIEPTPPGPEPVPAPVPTPEPGGEETSSDIPAYVTLGIAGAGAILGTVFGVIALQAKGDFNEPGGATVDNADKAERSALIADMSFGVALTFGITGVVLLVSGGEEEAPAEGAEAAAQAAPVLLPYAGPNRGGMTATWSF
ncbi:MAG: PEGA domain-containing protein [Myxococcales bacterium]|nr:PEGA domain-containing protein [Myxococcales bacterium]